MLVELQVGHLAREHGFVLRRNGVGYDLWKGGRFALRSATLIDVQTYLDAERSRIVRENMAKMCDATGATLASAMQASSGGSSHVRELRVEYGLAGA